MTIIIKIMMKTILTKWDVLKINESGKSRNIILCSQSHVMWFVHVYTDQNLKKKKRIFKTNKVKKECYLIQDNTQLFL